MAENRCTLSFLPLVAVSRAEHDYCHEHHPLPRDGLRHPCHGLPGLLRSCPSSPATASRSGTAPRRAATPPTTSNRTPTSPDPLGRRRARSPLGDRALPFVQSASAGVSRSGLTARELLAERLQRLVGRERARDLGAARAGVAAAAAAAGARLLGGVRRRLAGLDLGLGGLDLLLEVRLPAGVRLGVLLFPDGALLVEALEPLTGVRSRSPPGRCSCPGRRTTRSCRTASGRTPRPRRPWRSRWPA